MLNLLNKLLSKLPANNYKTIIGAVITGLCLLFPDFPKNDLGDVGSLVSKVISDVGQVILVVGVLHKFIKAKLKF